MDLETKGKKILEALAVQGEIASLEKEVAKLGGEISSTEREIQKVLKEEDTFKSNRSRANQVLEQVQADYRGVENQFNNAKRSLEVANAHVQKAQDDLLNYGSDAESSYVLRVAQLSKDKQSIADSRSKVQLQLMDAQKDLEARQQELRSENVEISFNLPTRPRVIAL